MSAHRKAAALVVALGLAASACTDGAFTGPEPELPGPSFSAAPASSLPACTESFEGGIPAGWTVAGVGGTFVAAANISPTDLARAAYIDTRGLVSIPGGTGGSTLTSSAFILPGGATVTLDFNFLTNNGAGFSDFMFIQIRGAGGGPVLATLANGNTTGPFSQAVPALGGPAPAISAGVTLMPATGFFDGVFTGPVGGISYGPGKFGGGNGGSTGWINSSYVIPATGTYELYYAVSDRVDFAVNTGLATDCLLFVVLADIDIKPGSFPNSINPKSMGVVPVAILGSDVFDVTDVDVTTLTFGPGMATPAHDLTDPLVYADHLQDVNMDGYTDLVSHYRQKDTGLAPGDTEACIMGATTAATGGVPLEGCDSVNVL